MSQGYQPPYSITANIFNAVAEISELLGRWSASHQGALSPQLRRDNRLRTIQASLAIEHNSLSLEQVTAILEGKQVLGLPREIQEVRNAFAAYEQLPHWQATNGEHLLAAHERLMVGLIDNAGQWRSGGVGIFRGKELVHMAPPAAQIPRLMVDLLGWLATTDAHPLIASCVFHYEFEFIHPFSDGNGRLGRLWQTLILSQWRAEMAYLPVESIIRDQQNEYYRVLGVADLASDCTIFVEFMLDALAQALQTGIASSPSTMSGEMSVKLSGKTPLAIVQALQQNPELTIPTLATQLGVSSRTIERHLQKLQQQGLLKRMGSAKGGYWQVQTKGNKESDV
ncbi:MAG: Fic family protein [Methylococcaceae bacterium]|nr:Fic family protein [Methylococcaceae bacterium]MDP2394993.1 Fic family protein [Methylococcaceae bacterium]MDP3019519.1 Fic family protein [Methylococcaceae bacterium]MDP3389629.1 Fic family protein [Methylococcaceae bacterium]MDP3930954.1 Fic family protein [Methylococcaceae bacterium]